MDYEETLRSMKESFSLSDMEPKIIGAKIVDSQFGPGTVIDCNHKLCSVRINFAGEISNMSFPHAFIKQIKFENDVLNEYVQAKVRCYIAALELGAAMELPECLYGMYILTLSEDDTAENRDVAFDYLARAAIAGSETASWSLLGRCSRRIEDNEVVSEEILQFALEITQKQADEGDTDAWSLLADYYYTIHDFKQAETILKAIVDCEDIDDEMKCCDAARLAGMYYTGKRGDSPDKNVYRNLQLAKRYYEIAIRGGFECDADLACVDRALGIEAQQNAMKAMAQEIIDAGYSKLEAYEYISANLRSEFDELWDTLPAASQVDLVSGCVVYCDLHALGETICRDIDFTAAIIPIVKAAEVVFRQHLCHGYYEYLLNHNVPATRFSNNHPLVEFDKQTRMLRYRNKESIVFTLGSIRYLIIDPYQREVHTEFLKYASELMGTNFTSQNALKDYLSRLSQRMTQFTFDIRNPAAHSEVMPQWQAEICGNEIILVKRILKEFVSRISFE